MKLRYTIFALISVFIYTGLSAYLPPMNLHYALEDEINLRLMWTAPEDIGGTYLMYQGFENNLIDSGWSHKKSNDLTGNNLVDVSSGTNSWFQVDATSFNNQGTNMIYSGNHSAGIRYNVNGFHWLISEDINLSGSNVLKFQLWYKNAPEYNWITEFHVMIYNNQQWTELQSYGSSSQNNLYQQMEEISLSGITGATRIAFVYEGSNGFQLAIDDIAVIEPTSSRISRSVDGYRIYRDDSLYTEVASTDTMEFIEGHDIGHFIYNVTAIYGTEESLPSNSIDITITNDELARPVSYLSANVEEDSFIELRWIPPSEPDNVLWTSDFEYDEANFPPHDLLILKNDEPEGYLSTMIDIAVATDESWNITNTEPYDGEYSLFINPGDFREFYFLITEANERDSHEVLNFELKYYSTDEMTTEFMVKAIVDDNDWKDLLIFNNELYNNNFEYRVSVPLEKADGDNAGIAFIYNKLSHSQVMIDNVSITRPSLSLSRNEQNGTRDDIPLTGYNIYMKTTEVDTLIASLPDTVTSYVIPRNSISQYNNTLFFVTAVYEEYESRRSNFFNTAMFDTPTKDPDIRKPELRISNYPNPFNPETTISYSLDSDSEVDITIYNIKGQKVKTIVNDFKTKGNHNVIWRGTDNNGDAVSTGIYLCRIQSVNKSGISKMLLIK